MTSDIDTRVHRGIAWVGVASSMVGLLDIAAFAIILSLGWVDQSQLGIATLATALFPVLDLATDLGLTAAVIQRDDLTDEKISTVFWINLAMSLVLVLILALGVGPLLSLIHGQPVLTWMLAAYGAKLLWQNTYFIPSALMKRELRFKELSLIRVVANLAEFAGKLGFAAAGAGVWVFVFGPLCRVVVTGVGVQLRHPWRPRLVLRWREARDWLAFGFRSSGSKILFFLYTNADYQVVGYYFGKEALGVYRTAYDLVLQPAMVISEIITHVAFPLFSRMKHETRRLVDQLISFSRMNLVVMIAFLGVVFVAADPIFEFLEMHPLLGGLPALPGAAALPGLDGVGFPVAADWSAGAPTARILCLVALLRALSFLVPPLLDGIGRPNLTLRYSVIASIVVPLGFVIGAETLGPRLGALSVAVAWAVSYPIAFAALFLMTFRALDFGPREYLRRVMRLPLFGGIALAGAELVHLVDGDLPGWARFGLAAITMLGGFALLLARFEGMTPAAVARSLRGK